MAKSLIDTVMKEAQKAIKLSSSNEKKRVEIAPKDVVSQMSAQNQHKPDIKNDDDTTKYLSTVESDVKKQNRKDIFKTFLKNIDTSKMELDKKEKNSINQGLDDIQNSFLCIIKMCDPNKCNHVNICPFTRIKKYPSSQPCPLEKCIAQHSADQYFGMLADEINGTEFNIVEINTVHSLVEVEVQEFRARNFVNNEGIVTEFAAFAVKRTGEVVYNKTENPVYNVMEKLSRRKYKLLQRLLLTPESKARFHVDNSKNRKDKSKEIIMRAEEKIRQFQEGDVNAPPTRSAKE